MHCPVNAAPRCARAEALLAGGTPVTILGRQGPWAKDMTVFDVVVHRFGAEPITVRTNERELVGFLDDLDRHQFHTMPVNGLVTARNARHVASPTDFDFSAAVPNKDVYEACLTGASVATDLANVLYLTNQKQAFRLIARMTSLGFTDRNTYPAHVSKRDDRVLGERKPFEGTASIFYNIDGATRHESGVPVRGYATVLNSGLTFCSLGQGPTAAAMISSIEHKTGLLVATLVKTPAFSGFDVNIPWNIRGIKTASSFNQSSFQVELSATTPQIRLLHNARGLDTFQRSNVLKDRIMEIRPLPPFQDMGDYIAARSAPGQAGVLPGVGIVRGVRRISATQDSNLIAFECSREGCSNLSVNQLLDGDYHPSLTDSRCGEMACAVLRGKSVAAPQQVAESDVVYGATFEMLSFRHSDPVRIDSISSQALKTMHGGKSAYEIMNGLLQGKVTVSQVIDELYSRRSYTIKLSPKYGGYSCVINSVHG